MQHGPREADGRKDQWLGLQNYGINNYKINLWSETEFLDVICNAVIINFVIY